MTDTVMSSSFKTRAYRLKRGVIHPNKPGHAIDLVFDHDELDRVLEGTTSLKPDSVARFMTEILRMFRNEHARQKGDGLRSRWFEIEDLERVT